MKLNIDFSKHGLDIPKELSLKLEREGKLPKSVSGLFSSFYCCDVGNQKLEVFERMDMFANGSFKKIYLLQSLSDEAQYTLAKMIKHKELKQPHVSAEDWKADAESALNKDYEVSTSLRENNVPYIVQIFRITFEEKIYNVMEYCAQKTLRDSYFLQLPLKSRIELVVQLFTAVAGMHEKGDSHLDIKPANILVTKVGKKHEIRLADFGTSEKLDYACLRMRSTLPAPEMVACYQHKIYTQNSTALDLWALGDILYLARFGESILGKFELYGKRVQREAFLRRALNNKQMELQCMYLDPPADKERLEKLRKERNQYEEELDHMVKKGQIYSSSVEQFLKLVEDKFGKSVDACERCIYRLFSLKPEDRPSAREVAKILSEWLSIQKSK